jgi:hypothetical protein
VPIGRQLIKSVEEEEGNKTKTKAKRTNERKKDKGENIAVMRMIEQVE